MNKEKNKVSVVIAGAGIVGLSCAFFLSDEIDDIVVVERELSFGRGISSRNSEVVHAGIYYPNNSKRAKFCIEGRRLLYEFCEDLDIKYSKCGKIIVGFSQEDENYIFKLYENAKTNEVEGIELLSEKGLKNKEPQLNGKIGIYSAETGIIDTHCLMRALERMSSEKGVIFSYGCELQKIYFDGNEFCCLIKDNDGKIVELYSDIFINCTGLNSFEVSKMLDEKMEKFFNFRFFKGEYFSVSNKFRNIFKRLIYPVPDKYGLGIHTVFSFDGVLKLGPNSFEIKEVDYRVDESHVNEFFLAGKKIIKNLKLTDLFPDMSGIRPKLFVNDEYVEDFYIEKKLNAFIDLVGIDSPGLTAALSIGRYVKKLCI